jgi:hypothetical protein
MRMPIAFNPGTHPEVAIKIINATVMASDPLYAVKRHTAWPWNHILIVKDQSSLVKLNELDSGDNYLGFQAQC